METSEPGGNSDIKRELLTEMKPGGEAEKVERARTILSIHESSAGEVSSRRSDFSATISLILSCLQILTLEAEAEESNSN